MKCICYDASHVVALHPTVVLKKQRVAQQPSPPVPSTLFTERQRDRNPGPGPHPRRTAARHTPTHTPEAPSAAKGTDTLFTGGECFWRSSMF